jgi:hypothetical protein
LSHGTSSTKRSAQLSSSQISEASRQIVSVGSVIIARRCVGRTISTLDSRLGQQNGIARLWVARDLTFRQNHELPRAQSGSLD